MKKALTKKQAILLIKRLGFTLELKEKFSNWYQGENGDLVVSVNLEDIESLKKCIGLKEKFYSERIHGKLVNVYVQWGATMMQTMSRYFLLEDLEKEIWFEEDEDE